MQILHRWQFDTCDLAGALHAKDEASMLLQHGDVLAGTLGVGFQAMLKTLCASQGLILRSACNFGGNLAELAATDPIRKKLSASAALSMMNIANFDDGFEQKLANDADAELTESFRRQKFFLGKPELDTRTGLMMMMSAVFSPLADALAELAKEYGSIDHASELFATALVRVMTLYPELDGNDIYLKSLLDVLLTGVTFPEGFSERVGKRACSMLREILGDEVCELQGLAEMKTLMQTFRL